MLSCTPPAIPLDPVSLDRPEGTGALLLGWARLESRASLPTQDARFILALGQTLLKQSPIMLFQAGLPDRPAAMLALCRSAGVMARWRLPGAREIYEPGDALCRDDETAAVLARQIVAQGRPLDLDRVPAASPLIPALREAMKGRGWLRLRPAAPCPRIELDPTWGEPESRFNAGRRSDFRRATRRAAEFGAVAFELAAPTPEQFDTLFDEAIGVELQGWKRQAGTAIASDPGKEAFFREYLRSAAEAGTLRIAFLRIDGKAAAMQLAVEWAGRYWLYKIGYDEAYARCSPGTLLMLHTLGEAARRGLRGYELLGEAEPWIAELWTREHGACLRLRTYPFNLRGAAAFACDALAWTGRRMGRAGR